MADPAIAEAFRQLQAGNAARALELARAAALSQPGAARAHLAEGIALRVLGRLGEAGAALAIAAKRAPDDAAIAYETGVVAQLGGDPAAALAQFDRARRLKPDFFAAHFSAGSLRFDRKDWEPAAACFRAALDVQPGQAAALRYLARALDRAGRAGEADAAFVHALAANPDDFDTLLDFGRHSVGRGNFRRAAKLFTEAWRLHPADEALPIYVAQAELLEGQWKAAWSAYRHRPTRRHFERWLAARGGAYRVPELGTLGGAPVCLVAEQGYGDILFFLRWAPLLAQAGARLQFLGPRALHSLLARTGLFGELHEFDAENPVAIESPILIGDLPSMVPALDPLTIATLRIAPLPERLAAWGERLERAGPRPWIGLTWRAGSRPEELAHGLYKTVPPEALLRAVAHLGGTPIALQRLTLPGEIESLGRDLGRPLHDFSRANDDLEDALALVALLDRHVGVSNTNMHLAAAAGHEADVLVPFPPEWRWRLQEDSPWFPGFRVHHQAMDGDWARAFAAIAP